MATIKCDLDQISIYGAVDDFISMNAVEVYKSGVDYNDTIITSCVVVKLPQVKHLVIIVCRYMVSDVMMVIKFGSREEYDTFMTSLSLYSLFELCQQFIGRHIKASIVKHNLLRYLNTQGWHIGAQDDRGKYKTSYQVQCAF